jgi:hypothetical protein
MDTWLNKIPTWTDEANALATGANTNKLAAEAAETNAKAARDKAEEWAENPEDTEVEEGQYSAKHHAAKASASVTNAETARDYANKWATEAADILVNDGVNPSDYSAYHYAQSALSAPGTSATSATSLTIGTGSKTLTIQTGKSIVVGMFVMIADTGTPANYMAGQVTSYTSGTGELIVDVKSTGGNGTIADWTISLSAITFDAATTAEMEAATETAIRQMSPANIKTAIDANVVETSLVTITKSANYTVSAADRTKMITCTGTFTLTFTAAATLGDGWFCYVKSLTGNVTLDPNAAETIDGVSTGTVEAGDIFLVSSDGTNLQCFKIYGWKPHYITTSNATWTVPAGITELFVQGCGGGGGGGYAIGPGRFGGGGAAGGYFEKTIAVSAGDTKNITIGGAGAGGTFVTQTVATAGGTTSFDTDCSATGGTPAADNLYLTANAFVAPGVGSSGDINLSGGHGYVSSIEDNTTKRHYTSIGGSSYFGAGAMTAKLSSDVSGLSATNYGSGGSGGIAHNNTASYDGGAGKQGIVIIWY